MQPIKPIILGSYIVIWNILMFLAHDLNNWQRRVSEPRALAIVSLLNLATGFLVVAVLVSPKVRSLVVKPEARPENIRCIFRLPALLCLFIGGISLAGLLLRLTGNI